MTNRSEVPPTGTLRGAMREGVNVRDAPLQPSARQCDRLRGAARLPPAHPRLVGDAEPRADLDLREQIRAVALARRLLRIEIERLERMTGTHEAIASRDAE